MECRSLLNLIEKMLNEQKILIERIFSYQEAGKIQSIRKYGQLLRRISAKVFISKVAQGDIYNSL